MSKGNLNDLIRQEANKEVEAEPSIAPTPKRPRETNATLQARIAELTKELQTGEEKAKTLQERIKTLEKELEKEKSRDDLLSSEERTKLDENLKTLQERIKTLEKDLEKERSRGDRLQSEESEKLEEAKTLRERVKTLEKELEKALETRTLLTEQTALVEKLSGQLQHSESELEAGKQLVEKLYSRIQTLENPPPKPESAPKPAVKKPSLYNFETRTLARYVAPKPSSTELTDTEIGWFD
jgi:chromosome segregation ATPase